MTSVQRVDELNMIKSILSKNINFAYVGMTVERKDEGKIGRTDERSSLGGAQVRNSQTPEYPECVTINNLGIPSPTH